MFSDKISKGRLARLPRAAIAAEMRRNGIPDAIASESSDLACHAVSTAFDSILETCDRASTPGGKLNALSVATALAKAELAILEDAMSSATMACGLTTIEATVGGQAHG